MYFRLTRNSISKNKLMTFAMLLFIAAAAMLLSLAAALIVNLSGAIDALMASAKTPHFMQMHSGQINTERLERFAQKNENVEAFQVLEFLNIEGANIKLGDSSLADNVQDNGICTQSSQFDFLLDLGGNLINAKDGEVYVPICYMKDGTAELGDEAVICGKKLTVAGFLRDSQMNSLLSSSKRFLVSENDYNHIQGFGTKEYLIEFRLNNLSALGAFETTYLAEGLETNGPTITYPQFAMINAISDGMMIAVILLISMLVVAIALLCVRYTLLATIEDEYREIGVLKALGLRMLDIKKIYLSKYAAIAAIGCLIGYALSFAFKGSLLENIRLYMGESKNGADAIIFGIISILLLFLIILAYVNGVLKRCAKISAVQAIRFGASQEDPKGSAFMCLSKNRLLNTNIFLGLKDVFVRRKLYGTMLTVLVISAFMIIVPQNLYNTVASKNFIRYMGVGYCDIRVDIQQTDNISEKTAEVAAVMSKDSGIANHAVFHTKTYKAKMDDGTEESIKIDIGDHSAFPIEYTFGRYPAADNEIALSAIIAGELNKKVDDHIHLSVGGIEKVLSVCGIYSDITNGGKTAKGTFFDDTADVTRSVIYAEADQPNVNEIISEYADRFNYAKISGIDTYMSQTFGSTVNAIGMASYTASILALIITVLITMMFIKMLISKDKQPIAVMKAFGFSNADIITQYITRSVFVLIIGMIIGTILSNTLGELLAGGLLSAFGVASFNFEVNLFSAYVLSPLLMIGAVLIATIIGTAGAGRIKISEYLKE